MDISTNRMKTILGAVVSCMVLTGAVNALARGVTCRVDVDRQVLQAGEKQRAIVKVTLDAPTPPETAKRPPVNLALVLDRSGSMTGSKLQKAKEAAIDALRRLSPRDIFSLVIYDHVVETLVPAQNAHRVEWIEGQIRSIRARGNTALFGGVSQGAAELRKNMAGKYVHRLILLSDGLANVGPRTPADLGRLGAALLKENISVTTVGVGTDYNEDLMTQLAQNSDGNSYFVESSEDLPRIFAAELGDVLNVVAKKVLLTIECPEGIRPISIIGRDGRISGRRVELYLNQLYGGQEKYALVEIEVPASRANELRQIAMARVSYVDAFTQSRESASGDARVRFSDKKEEVRRSANVEVQREYNLNLNAHVQDQAVDLADKGKTKEAAEALRESSKMLREVGVMNRDEALLQKAEDMEEKAGQIEAEGLTKRGRKALRTDSYQQRNQQTTR